MPIFKTEISNLFEIELFEEALNMRTKLFTAQRAVLRRPAR